MATGLNGVLIQPNTHYLTNVPTGGDEPDPDDVAAGIWGVWGTQIRACMPTFVTVHSLVVAEEVLKPDIGVVGAHTVELAGTHSGTGDSYPEGMVPLINLHTNTRSRSARGWHHLASSHWSDDISYNAWSSGYQTTLNAYAALLDDAFDLGTVLVTHVRPVIYSVTRRKNGFTPYTFDVVKATANTTPHWLRSRMTAP